MHLKYFPSLSQVSGLFWICFCLNVSYVRRDVWRHRRSKWGGAREQRNRNKGSCRNFFQKYHFPIIEKVSLSRVKIDCLMNDRVHGLFAFSKSRGWFFKIFFNHAGENEFRTVRRHYCDPKINGQNGELEKNSCSSLFGVFSGVFESWCFM